MSEAAEHKHPNYIGVWGLLFVLTAVEIGVAFLSWAKEVLIVILVGLALWKALLVALYYMHLRYEGNRMRVFAVAPIPLAVIIVAAVLTEFVW